MEIWQLWIIAGVILFILEIFTPVFVEASFGIGCFVAALTAALGGSVTVQFIVFGLTVIVVFFTVRPLFMKVSHRYSDKRKIGVEALIGKTCLVTEAIDNDKNTGRVQIGGENWKASSENGEPIPEGEKVVVKRIEGITVYVVKLTSGG